MILRPISARKAGKINKKEKEQGKRTRKKEGGKEESKKSKGDKKEANGKYQRK